jgi:hypothetical protein
VTFGRVGVAACLVVMAATLAVVPIAHEAAPPPFAAPRDAVDWPLAPGREQQQRDTALRAARVWTATNPATANFKSNPPDPSGLLSAPDGVVRCRYLSDAPHATTPKFDCVLTNGEVVKVKYGWATAEVRAEVAASHLMTSLGFGADHMFYLPRVRCFGCPRFPFEVNQVLDRLGARQAVVRRLPEDRFVDFEDAAVERRLPGHEIVAGDRKGWAWWELDRESPAGARRAELDAFRLVGRFIAHWDNKASNQRLVCLSPIVDGQTCPRPFAFIHDLGATFGPEKIDLERWEAAHIWADAKQCRVSMKDMPYDGGTLPDAEISEEGRALALRQLGALSESQITDLFEAAHFDTFRGWHLKAWPISAWTRAFRAKVEEIRLAGPCPDHNG